MARNTPPDRHIEVWFIVVMAICAGVFMEKNWFRQVLLERADSHTVVWIPDEGARIGKILNLEQSDGSWDENWTVKRVYGNRTERTNIEDAARSWKKAKLGD